MDVTRPSRSARVSTPISSVANPIVQGLDALVERAELTAFDFDPVDMGANDVGERGARLLELLDLAGELISRAHAGIELGGDVAGDFLDSVDRFLDVVGMPGGVIQLLDLDLHVPDHLVQPVRFDNGALDDVFLVLEHLDLLRHVLGERIQAGQAFLGRAAHLLELRQHAEALLHVADDFRCRSRPLVRLDRALLHLMQSGGDFRRQAPELVDLFLKGGGILCGRGRVFRGLLHVAANLLDRRVLALERLEALAGRCRLRGERVDRLAVLLQPAIGPHQGGGLLLCSGHHVDECADSALDRFQLGRTRLRGLQTVRNLIDPLVGIRHQLLDVLQRLAGGREFRALQLNLGEHRAERRALLT